VIGCHHGMHRRFRYRRRIRNAPKSDWAVYSIGLAIKAFIGVNCGVLG
jgi:hypothetical protein